jgi:hypothetical protein
MTHVWQHTLGYPQRRSYHDREWADKMKEIGLKPSTTARQTAKRSGSHGPPRLVVDSSGLAAYR